MMRRTAVIGAGLTGLTVAHVLAQRKHEVILLETEPRVGGQLHTVIEHGYVVEHGAEGFVTRSEAVPRLAREVGLGDELIDQVTTRSLGYRGGELRELAPGEAAAFLGFQVPKADFGGGVRTFRRGMGSLSDALATALAAEAEVSTETAVTHLERKSYGFRLSRAGGPPIDAHQVVLATSAKGAALLLEPIIGPVATPLMAAPTLSSVTVSLAYDRTAVSHPLDASGLVVAAEDQVHGIRAAAFTSTKFEHRAPSGKVLLRVFFRPTDHDLKLGSDSTFAARAADFLAKALGIQGGPEHAWVSRWPHALPVFTAAHQEQVRALNEALAGSGVALAGSAYFGAGIDAAVRSALNVEERL